MMFNFSIPTAATTRTVAKPKSRGERQSQEKLVSSSMKGERAAEVVAGSRRRPGEELKRGLDDNDNGGPPQKRRQVTVSGARNQVALQV